jgi:hypothetical protein
MFSFQYQSARRFGASLKTSSYLFPLSTCLIESLLDSSATSKRSLLRWDSPDLEGIISRCLARRAARLVPFQLFAGNPVSSICPDYRRQASRPSLEIQVGTAPIAPATDCWDCQAGTRSKAFFTTPARFAATPRRQGGDFRKLPSFSRRGGPQGRGGWNFSALLDTGLFKQHVAQPPSESGRRKVHYRGIAKSANRLFVACALANLFMARRHFFRAQGT